jgi:hypothetical protein
MTILTAYIKNHQITRRLKNSGYERMKKEAITNGNQMRQVTRPFLGHCPLKGYLFKMGLVNSHT